MKQAQLILSSNERVNEQKGFVQNSSGPFVILPDGEELVVIVKEVEQEKQNLEKVRMLAGRIAQALRKQKVEQLKVCEKELEKGFHALSKNNLLTAFVEGFNLGLYTFDKYLSKKEANPPKLHLETADQDAILKGEKRAQAVNFARDLMNELPDVLNPETFPTVLKDAFKDTAVDVQIFDEKKLQKMEMNGLLAVCRGSKHAPKFVELTYKGDADKPLIALVGKGVTYDTGGISLKIARNISDMRMDMGGAAAVAGAMHLLAHTEANVNVVALIPIVENIPDANSLLPGEVIQYKNGHTVQVGNTDAEGRLILADGLIRAEELGADYVIDIATLTGAIVQALGTKVGGIFGDEGLSLEMKKIGDENGDFVWPMPLVDDYESYLKSDYADFSNISSKSEAGSITAALFLRKFVKKPEKWIHIDMASVMEGSGKGYDVKGGSGFGARLLADFSEYVSK